MQHARADLRNLYANILQNASADEAAILAWRLVSGSVVASQTRVLGLRYGILQVEVHDVAWRIELLHLSSDYIDAMNKMVGRKVHRIEFLLPGQARKAFTAAA